MFGVSSKHLGRSREFGIRSVGQLIHTRPVMPTSMNVTGVVVRQSNASFHPFIIAMTMHPMAVVELYAKDDTLSPIPSSNFITSLEKLIHLVL